MTDATENNTPVVAISETSTAIDLENKVALVSSLAEKFNELKTFIAGFAHLPTPVGNAIHYIDTAYLWMEKGILTASAIATEAQTLGVPLPESAQVVADVVNDLASTIQNSSPTTVIATDASPTP